MVKVIVGYKVKKGVDLQPVLTKLRSHAMQYSGFVSAENYVRTSKGSIIMVVYTWQNAQGWTVWEKSTIRQEILKEAESLLEDKPKVTIYTIAPTVQWI
jgi:antibiotic biosynthesis monooxygenase (ABM) superfamily enzyme